MLRDPHKTRKFHVNHNVELLNVKPCVVLKVTRRL